jgi:hypothetical protein
MEIIKGKELVGLRFADGVHWHWGDTEVAVINEVYREIEWCDRVFKFPEEVVSAVRSKMPVQAGQWLIEARRNRISTTQGSICIFVNNQYMDMAFKDEYVLVNGEYESINKDEDLGKFVYASLWHSHDSVYRYSDRFKSLFKPDWRDEK